MKTITLTYLNTSCLDCRGWRSEGAANTGYFDQSLDNVTWKAAYVPLAAVLDCRPEPPVVCSPPSVPAPKPQRALHGWEPPCISASGWVTAFTGLGVGQRRDGETSLLPPPPPKKKKGSSWFFIHSDPFKLCLWSTYGDQIVGKYVNKWKKYGLRFHICFKAIDHLSNLLYF